MLVEGGEVVPADQPAQLHLAAAQESEQQEQDCLLVRERSLGLGPPAKLLVYPLQRVGGAQRLPLRDRVGRKGEQFVAGFLEAFDDRLTAQPPLAHEPRARLLHRRATLGVDSCAGSPPPALRADGWG